MILTVNLFWLFFAIPATFLFAYVSSSGLYLLISASRSLPRVRLIQGGIIIAMLFGTYAACFTPAPSQSLSFLMNLSRSLHAFPVTPKPTLPKTWFRLPLPEIVQTTTGVSHAVCVGLGVMVVGWLSAFVGRMKGRGVEEYQYGFVERFMGVLFHMKFFLGTFLWYRYFLMPVSTFISAAPPTTPDTITTLGASILGLSHTLAFSMGFFIHYDYHERALDKRSESEIMRYYLSLAGVMVAGRLVFQGVCDATGLDPTSHDILLLSAAISMFILFNNKSYSLMNYFWLPLAAARAFPPPYPNGWYRLLSGDEVGKGEMRLVNALGREFVVFRGEDGSVGVLNAICPHLGANMGIGGKVVGNAVECPFHGWQFDQTGKCVAIPYASSIPEIAKTKTWPVREVAGLVCIYFDAEGREPLYEPRPFPLEGKMRYLVATKTATLAMHIQDFAENAADWMHFGKVHTRLSLPILDRFLYVKHRNRWAPSTGDDGPLTNTIPPFAVPATSDPNTKFLPVPDDPLTSTHLSDATIHHFTFYDIPTLHSVFSDTALPSGGLVYFRFSTPYGEVTGVKTFLPVGGEETGLMLHMRDDVWAERGVPWLLARHVWNEAAKAFDDDIFLWCGKGYLGRPIFVKEDRPVKRFREFYKRNYSPNSRTFSSEGGLSW
ncbi:hypothetical protein BC829DRAFT_383778 [Chytridium lagenaria]|nr:hypothetical protein BC829DRAFT_383778 [Chytridium lagenaria]